MGLFCIETVFDKNHFLSNLRLFWAPKTGFCLSSSNHVSKDKKKTPIWVPFFELFLSNFSKKRWFKIQKRSKAFLYADMTGLDKVQFTVYRIFFNLSRNGIKVPNVLSSNEITVLRINRFYHTVRTQLLEYQVTWLMHSYAL